MDTLILTANSRLSIYLKRQYDQKMQQNKRQTWTVPQIMPLNNWIEAQWLTTYPTQRLLTTQQQQQLWIKISTNLCEQHNLHTNSTATLMMQAWQMLSLWNISLTEFKIDTAETQLLGKAIALFEAECQTKQWICSCQLPISLLEKWPLWTTNLPKKIDLIGFDSLPATQQHIIDKLSSQCEIIQTENAVKISALKRFECIDEEDELNCLAQWAKQQWLANPNNSIGCIIPNLETIRAATEQAFYTQFQDEIIGEETQAFFNLSAGKKLTEFALIDTALTLIKLAAGGIDINTYSHLMQSPYLCLQEDDIDIGALTDSLLRDMNDIQLPLTAVFHAFNKAQAIYPDSTWVKRYHVWHTELKSLKESASAAYWAKTFIHLLEIMQWPGNRGLSSTEYQVLQRWRLLLKEFSQLDLVIPSMTLKKAIQLISSMAASTVFQPEGSTAPIQILGVLESAQLTFDAVWIMGLDSEQWPPNVTGNPFIPHRIQSQYQLPHCNANHEYQYCHRTLTRLLKSATSVIVSSASQSGDKQLAPSEMITHITAEALPKQSQQRVKPTTPIEQIIDNQSVAMTTNSTLKGGTEIIKLQAACPFKANALLRLKAKPLNVPNITIEATEKGNIIHHALHQIWHNVKSQVQLKEMTEQQIDDLISQSCKKAIKEPQKPVHSTLHHYLLQTEQKRANTLIKQWLDFEKNRPDFTVEQCETVHELIINNNTIRCRIDRIDQCNDGRYLIDYKTGVTHINQWFGARMLEPQLPTYCSFIAEIDGICFAQIRSDALVLKGIMTHTSNDQYSELLPIDKIKHPDNIADWATQKQYWKVTVEKLLFDFCTGEAAVDPVHPESTCQYCHLKPFCRVEHANE